MKEPSELTDSELCEVMELVAADKERWTLLLTKLLREAAKRIRQEREHK